MRSLADVRDAEIARWEGRLTLWDGGAFDPRSVIAALPAMVGQAYAPIDPAQLQRAAVGLCFFSDVIVGIDDLIDYRHPDDLVRLPRFMVLFSEAHRLFAEVLGGHEQFWQSLRHYFAEYLDALDVEARIVDGSLAWEQCTFEDAVGIARGKNGLVRLVDATIAALAGESPNGTADALLHAFVSAQMCDDLGDWEEDVRNGALSPLLRSACATKPQVKSLQDIAVAIYTQGHAARVLAVAEEEANRAIALAESSGATDLAALVVQRRRRVREMQLLAVGA